MIMQECDHRLARGTGSSGEETVVTRGRCCWGMAHCTPTPHHTHHLIRSAASRARVTCYSYMLVVRIARPGPVLVPGTRVTRVTLIAGLLTILTSGPCSDLALASLE